MVQCVRRLRHRSHPAEPKLFLSPPSKSQLVAELVLMDPPEAIFSVTTPQPFLFAAAPRITGKAG